MKLLEELHQEIITNYWTKYFEVIDQAEKPSLFTNMAKLDERF
ncbi:hypothetical protein NX021_15475 [Cytobacillus firmus]|nr:hypothetical protein [Cytobacillus firmus]